MKPKQKLDAIRRSYDHTVLHRRNLDPDPLKQFVRWFDAARHHHPEEANVMTLATADAIGQPSARIVLLKGLEKEGFVFYTNYNSRKAQDLDQNRKAALLFFWPLMEQQVRIEGIITKVNSDTCTTYFKSRPRGSQLSAWASPQSSIIENRTILTERIEVLSKQYQDGDPIPRPPFWGGYVLKPVYFEFWQGRQNRLHDRFAYQLADAERNAWTIDRLAP